MNILTRLFSKATPGAAPSEADLLADRLRQIDQRLAQLEVEIPQAPTGSPAYNELLTEQADLTTLRRTSDLRLRTLTMPPDPKQVARQQRRDALVRRRERELREGWNQAADNFARQGDHYSARQMRLNAISAREFAEAEFEQ